MTCSLVNYEPVHIVAFSLTLCHLSPGSSMVRASHRGSKGCGFDSRLGLRNIFLPIFNMFTVTVVLISQHLHSSLLADLDDFQCPQNL